MVAINKVILRKSMSSNAKHLQIAIEKVIPTPLFREDQLPTREPAFHWNKAFYKK